MRKTRSEQFKGETLPRKQRPSLVTSALSNWAPLGINILIILLLWPYLISQLGKERFGVWALVNSFIGYFGLIRLGVGTGIMRYVPFYVGRNNNKAASEIINTGLSMFLLVGLVMVLFSMLMAEPIARFYKAGPKFAILVRVIGLSAAIECPLRIFDAGLRAQERWIAANSITITTAVMRAFGLVGCIFLGYGLVEMGYVVLAVTVFSLILITIVFVRLCPTIRLGTSMVRLFRVRELLFYGFLTVIITLAYSLGLQSHKLIVGKLVSLEAVTVYAVAAALAVYVRGIVWAPLQVAWPRFALLDGENSQDEVIRLFRRVTHYSTILASGIVLLVIVAGPCFIHLWVPAEDFTAAYPVLIILCIGCLIEGSLFANSSLLGGTGRQGANAIFASIEGVLAFVLSILLGLQMGMIGVAVGFTIAVTFVRGIICVWYVCHLLRVSLLQHYVLCFLRPWTITALLAVLAYSSGIIKYVHNWPSFVAFATVVVLLYTICAWTIAMDRDEKVRMMGLMRKLSVLIPFAASIKK